MQQTNLKYIHISLKQVLEFLLIDKDILIPEILDNNLLLSSSGLYLLYNNDLYEFTEQSLGIYWSLNKHTYHPIYNYYELMNNFVPIIQQSIADLNKIIMSSIASQIDDMSSNHSNFNSKELIQINELQKILLNISFVELVAKVSKLLMHSIHCGKPFNITSDKIRNGHLLPISYLIAKIGSEKQQHCLVNTLLNRDNIICYDYVDLITSIQLLIDYSLYSSVIYKLITSSNPKDIEVKLNEFLIHKFKNENIEYYNRLKELLNYVEQNEQSLLNSNDKYEDWLIIIYKLLICEEFDEIERLLNYEYSDMDDIYETQCENQNNIGKIIQNMTHFALKHWYLTKSTIFMDKDCKINEYLSQKIGY